MDGCGARVLPQALCPATARCRVRGTRWAGLSTCWPSLLEPRCPRGGRATWAGVLLLAQPPRRSRACPPSACRCSVETPPPGGQTERATLRLRAPQAGHGGAALATGGEEVISCTGSPAAEGSLHSKGSSKWLQLYDRTLSSCTCGPLIKRVLQSGSMGSSYVTEQKGRSTSKHFLKEPAHWGAWALATEDGGDCSVTSFIDNVKGCYTEWVFVPFMHSLHVLLLLCKRFYTL